MAIYSFAVRPFNMLRSTQVRATSPHTSNWGLARLSNRANSPTMKQEIYRNLFSRISQGTVSIGSLYGFDRQILAEAFKRSKDSTLIRLLETIKPGKVEIRFKGRGIDMVEVIDRNTGRSSRVKESYEQDTVRTIQGYNLPFFMWMRDVIGQDRWGGIVRAIGNEDRLLAKNLENLEGRLSAEQEALRRKYPLPTKKSIRMA